MSTAWSSSELERVGGATELRVTSQRADGSLRPFVTIWVVRVDDDLYIRSAYGSDNPWFRRARRSGIGRVRAGGVERDLTFEAPDPGIHARVDAAYHGKYDRYGPQIVDTVVGTKAAEVTLRLAPRD